MGEHPGEHIGRGLLFTREIYAAEKHTVFLNSIGKYFVLYCPTVQGYVSNLLEFLLDLTFASGS